ncbi:MAG: hypothetical protein GY792_05325 [Gammaproteobacteria bacterium]|nr:hypothetical protein [Gammaproteobacteria bacterium]
MINWKALFAGIAVVIVLGLFMQLLFTMVVVAQMELGRDFPAYSGIIKIIPYLIGFGGYFLVMAIGGYVTASIALNRVVINALIVGATTTGFSLWLSISAGNIRPLSLIFFILGMVFTVSGALFWRIRQKRA